MLLAVQQQCEITAGLHQCVLHRQLDLLRKLMFAEEQTIAVVGHSLFFRKVSGWYSWQQVGR
jgi:hypothetical protein